MADDDGVVVWESHAILRYLAARYGPAWWPYDPAARAEADGWMDWAQTAFEGRLGDVARLNVTQAESHSAALGPRAYRQLLAQNQNDIAIYRHALDRLLTETAPVEVRLIA